MDLTFNEILVEDVKKYLNIYENDSDTNISIQTILNSAKSYILSYTGQTEQYLNSKNDIIIALYALCSQYFDNTDNSEMVHRILNLHSRNLIFS